MSCRVVGAGAGCEPPPPPRLTGVKEPSLWLYPGRALGTEGGGGLDLPSGRWGNLAPT